MRVWLQKHDFSSEEFEIPDASSAKKVSLDQAHQMIDAFFVNDFERIKQMDAKSVL
jgi:hypothetical protein